MNNVEEFEQIIANYCGSRYAVAVDSCTNALYLSLLYCIQNNEIPDDKTIFLPKRTYHQVPRAIIRAGLKIKFEDHIWLSAYPLLPTRIYDSAVYFNKDIYIPDTLYCLSFNYRKSLPIGKGGMILVDKSKEKNWLDKERYNDYLYMTPEQASRGISLFEGLNKKYSYLDYPDLSKWEDFR